MESVATGLLVMGGIEYLLTWNFAHLANATIRSQIERKIVHTGSSRRSFVPQRNYWENKR